MQKRIKLGRTAVPVGALVGYASSGLLLAIDWKMPFGDYGRIAIVAFIAGAVAHILDRIDQKTEVVEEKIDDSVGPVWDAGEKSGRRNQRLEASRPVTLAAVRELGRR